MDISVSAKQRRMRRGDLRSAFLSQNNVLIDTYDDKARWKEAVRSLGLKGLHLAGDEASIARLKEFYVFSSLPFYVVTDTTGRPLNIDGGIRPSTNARRLLLGLLGKSHDPPPR
jgi:hypothetical protein